MPFPAPPIKRRVELPGGLDFRKFSSLYDRAREALSVGVSDARGNMLRTHAWKYAHVRHFPQQLFNSAMISTSFAISAAILPSSTYESTCMRADDGQYGISIGKW